MDKEMKKIEQRLERLKVRLRDVPKEMKRNFAWHLMKETMINDFSSVMWFYDEMARFVDSKFKK